MVVSTLSAAFLLGAVIPNQPGTTDPKRMRSDPPPIRSSWDDLTEGIDTPEDWERRKELLRRRFLDLLRDEQKPPKPLLEFQVHEEVEVDQRYKRQLISYNVEEGERAHAYLGTPLEGETPFPGIVALHGTYPRGKDRAAALVDNPDKAYLDHLCRRGYVVIAPDHFVAGHRIPEEGPYETEAFHRKHPDWTAVGKFTYEHAIAIDVLENLPHVDKNRIGAMGHSLGGHGTLFLAAYDDRIKAAACNCGGAFFRHNSKVEAWSRDQWYVYFKHLRPGLLQGELPPIDFHEIMALVAPRAFLDLSSIQDGDPLTQKHRVLMLMKVMDIYELLGQSDQFAFFVHGKGHAVPYESRQLLYGWLDTHLKSADATEAHLIDERTAP